MDATVVAITVERKLPAHQFFGEGSPVGYAVNGVQGAVLVMKRGRRYKFVVRTPRHPFYFTTDSTGSPSDRTGAVQLPGAKQDSTDAIFVVTIPVDYSEPTRFYFQCHSHPKMGGAVEIVGEPVRFCFNCHADGSGYVCQGCQAAVYCGSSCQRAEWIAHRTFCPAGSKHPKELIFLATGYFAGTRHHVTVTFSTETFTDRLRGTIIRLPSELVEGLRSAADRYVETGQFHMGTERDQPQGGDRGVSRFIYGDLYASPPDVPVLARFFLEIEPRLSANPGGLSTEK